MMRHRRDPAVATAPRSGWWGRTVLPSPPEPVAEPPQFGAGRVLTKTRDPLLDGSRLSPEPGQFPLSLPEFPLSFCRIRASSALGRL